MFSHDGELKIVGKMDPQLDGQIKRTEAAVRGIQIFKIIFFRILKQHGQGPLFMEGQQNGIQAEQPFRSVQDLFISFGIVIVGNGGGDAEPAAGLEGTGQFEPEPVSRVVYGVIGQITGIGV